MLIRDSLQLYREEFGKILLLGLLVVFPVQFLCLIINNYLYTYYGSTQIHVAEMFYGISILLATSLVQIPFIKMLECYKKREYIDFARVYGSFWEYGFVVFVMGIIYTLGVTTGTFLFIIPGLIFMVLFYTFPYVVILEKKKWWQAFKLAFQFGKKNFWKLFGIIFGFAIFEWAVEWIVHLLAFLITDRYLVIALAVMFVNMLFVPLFAFINASFYTDWKEQNSCALKK
ncbi:hypothetical protein [Thermoactinomyces mirandus]|uniref:Uncharacterized protein n=1 Tax=Thermoactinomyces mirandus TaxID=2756294 RepID=A0A7W2AQ52_9BACL|nr:hypothetical protein [Thermoactinomyces mirandus]MBA4600922.1 hypothetical protein [Thermoactinomyces mirandus]